MRKTILTIAAIILVTVGTMAQVTDAFKGIEPVTDPSMKRSLNGMWNLKVSKGIGDDTSIPQEDNTWGKIPVPGCWEVYGFCTPKYDSPNRLTGYYRTQFKIPSEWKGMRIALRFDGVLYGYDLWINGKPAGSWRSGYNTALFDITEWIDNKNDYQELAMRVISQFKGSDFDYNDDWAPNGIIRDVTLMAIPNTHLADITITPRLNGIVDISTKIANPRKNTKVKHEILDAQGKIVGSRRVMNPHLWTAETPYLYTLRTTLLQKGKALQTFEHKFGFRELTIDGKVLKLNGHPIKLRGINSHATDPKNLKVVSEALTLKDMCMMKEASINYIRTSHYPREPRFYELADSIGFYIINEVPFGYGDKNLSDSTFYPILQQRAQATIRRDKNHPSVLIWSLGNENPLTDICVRLGSYVKEKLDTLRPICYPQVGSYFTSLNYNFPQIADIYAPHYPKTSELADFYQKADRPIIFTEYCHSLGISFEDHDRQWEIIEHTPWIAGGSVWEWTDQGIPFKCSSDDQGSEHHYGYEERVFTSPNQGFEMAGNKGTDGMLFVNRTPLPNYYELQHNYACAAAIDSIAYINENSEVTIHIRNRYDFINLKDNIKFNWFLTADRDTICHGTFSPDCAPHQTIPYQLHLTHWKERLGIRLLHLTISDKADRVILCQTLKIKDTCKSNVEDACSLLFNRIKNNLSECEHGGNKLTENFMVRVGRKESMAERLRVSEQRIERYLQPLDNPYVRVDLRSEELPSGKRIRFSLLPETTNKFLSELGIAFLLDSSVDRVQWIGYGPYPSYPGRQQANRYGFWALHTNDIYFEGNRMNVNAALMTDSIGNGVLLYCQKGNINFENTDRGIVVTYNVAVAGQGPKFRRTAFPIISKELGKINGEFYLFKVDAKNYPSILKEIFSDPHSIRIPAKHFITQYDTYLMRYNEIKGK